MNRLSYLLLIGMLVFSSDTGGNLRAQANPKSPAAGATLAALTADSSPQARLTRIEEQIAKDSLRVALTLSRAVSYHKFVLKNPERLVIDFSPCTLDLSLPPVIKDPSIQGLRFAQFNKDTVRVVFVSDKPPRYTISKQGETPFLLLVDFPRKSESINLPKTFSAVPEQTKPLSAVEPPKDQEPAIKTISAQSSSPLPPPVFRRPPPQPLSQAMPVTPAAPALPTADTMPGNNLPPSAETKTPDVPTTPLTEPPDNQTAPGEVTTVSPAEPGPALPPVPLVPPAPPAPGVQPPLAPPSPVPPVSPGRPQPGKPGLAKRGEVSFNFDDADVFSVVQTIFGGVLKVNYIIDPKVKGRVNFRSVAPVAKEDVMPLMEVILRLNGIGVVEEGGLYRIIPLADMPREPAPVGIGRAPEKIIVSGLGLLQVVPLRYLPSTEMVRVLTPFLSTSAVMVDVPKINYIIIVDTDANIKRLLQLVEIFDSEQLRQIKPQVFVYPVQNSKAKDLASLLQQIYLGAARTTPTPSRPTTTTPTARPTTPGTPTPTPTPSPVTTIGPPAAGEGLVSELTRIFADEVTNSLIILATPDDYILILETIKKLDIVPRQVMIEVLIAEITLGDDLRFGLEWSMRTKTDKGFSQFGYNSQSLPFTDSSGRNLGFTFFGIDKLGLIQGLLQTLASESKANILAAPHILARDNYEARIQIGDQVPIKTSDSATSGVATSTYQYKDTGVILKIKPLINDGGLVSLDLTQEVSDYFLQTIYGQEFPVITKREAATNLVAQDGQTIVIGGLIREKVGRTREGLPLLSKIPILGYLFGYTSDEMKRSEIILLLTPRVIRNQQEAENINTIYIHRLDQKTRDQFKLEEMTTRHPLERRTFRLFE